MLATRRLTPFFVVLAIASALLVWWPVSYQATATVRTESSQAGSALRTRALGFAKVDPLIEALGVGRGLATSVGVDVSVRAGTSVAVTARHTDPRFAQAVADTVAFRAAAADKRAAVTTAVVPTSPAGPGRLLLLGFAGLLGLLASLIWTAFGRAT